MMYFKDDGVPNVLTSEEYRELLNERSLLRIKLANARIRAERSAQRCDKAYADAHLQRVRADRLESIINNMNSSLRYLADETASSLLNDVEVNPS